MCGILLCLRGYEPSPGALEALRKRGPDHLACVSLPGLAKGPSSQALGGGEGEHVMKEHRVRLYASVLHMQGTVEQPLVDEEHGVAVAFNGELYSMGKGEQESTYILSSLVRCPPDSSPHEWVHALEAFEGEWGVVMFKSGKLVWCRDYFGRRSLVEGRVDGELAFVCSTPFASPTLDIEWLETPVDGVFEYNLATGESVKHPRSLVWKALEPLETVSDWAELMTKCLYNAVAKRCKEETLGGRDLGIMFSGGVDSVVLAGLAHSVLAADSPIVLVNVSFTAEESPDRIAARDALAELRKNYPLRKFVFIPVDVSLDDVRKFSRTIQELIHPKDTVMDFNIASVLYFASRGAKENGCRALLSGLGADELFGGYKRHKSSTKGKSEMARDLDRLWTRNLGRDDRVVASNQCELRLPFLDLEVVHIALSSLDGTEIVGVPEFENKPLVRTVAWKLGLKATAEREKRAAQFGSRVAKLIRADLKGSDRFDPETAFDNNS